MPERGPRTLCTRFDRIILWLNIADIGIENGNCRQSRIGSLAIDNFGSQRRVFNRQTDGIVPPCPLLAAFGLSRKDRRLLMLLRDYPVCLVFRPFLVQLLLNNNFVSSRQSCSYFCQRLELISFNDSPVITQLPDNLGRAVSGVPGKSNSVISRDIRSPRRAALSSVVTSVSRNRMKLSVCT